MYQAPKSTLSDSIPSQFSSEQDPLFYLHIWANLLNYVSNMVHVKGNRLQEDYPKIWIGGRLCQWPRDIFIVYIYVLYRIVWSYILHSYPQCQPTLQVIPGFGSPLSPFQPCRDFVSSMFLCRKGEFPSHFHTYHVVRGGGGFVGYFALVVWGICWGLYYFVGIILRGLGWLVG